MNKKGLRPFFYWNTYHMKYIIASAVVCLLIGAPLGSYFYLKSGFVYRLESLADLKPKELSADLKSVFDLQVPHNNKVRLIYLEKENNPLASDQFNAIQDKIVDTSYFQTVRVQGDPEHYLTAGGDYDFYLLDTAGVLRNYYASNDQTLKEIIRHLSVVIPLQKRNEIKLERDIKKASEQ